MSTRSARIMGVTPHAGNKFRPPHNDARLGAAQQLVAAKGYDVGAGGNTFLGRWFG
ncbi:MAG: hypothetical protein R2911_31435 [Caldilineaceae bacterium]